VRTDFVKFEPIRRRSPLVDTVAQRIRAVIERGHLGAGDRLPSQADLATQFGVSRHVLREAVGRLQSLGLLTVRRGRGIFVGDHQSVVSCAKMIRSAMAIAPKELVNFARFRTAIECYAAREAARLATAEDLAELESLCTEMDREGQEDLEAIRLDMQFHRKVVEIVGDELLRNVMAVAYDFILAGMVQTTGATRPRDRECSLREHPPIVAALRAGDPDAAERAMRAHMDAVLSRLQQLEEQPKESN
jgi:GntR family transcriptional repressor for pyruvate dehydrogenase complex